MSSSRRTESSTVAPILLLTGALALAACHSSSSSWQVVASNLNEALLSVSGTSSKDVWVVGADQGAGPIVLHFNGTTWTRIVTGTTGNLWWSQAFSDGTVLAAGDNSTIVQWNGTSFSRMLTPGLATYTVYGLWGSSSTNVYAVGSISGHNGFVWHYDGTAWTNVTLPTNLPLDYLNDTAGFFKVWGNGTDVWVVGGAGTVLHSSAGGPFTLVPSGLNDTTFAKTGNSSLTAFTASGNDSLVVTVGGGANGFILEGPSTGGPLKNVTPGQPQLLQGVAVKSDGTAYASGAYAIIYARSSDGKWSVVDTGLEIQIASLHSIWIDPDGGVWSAGGQVLSTALNLGALVHSGATIPGYTQPKAPPAPPAVCPTADIDPAPNGSIARRWDEQTLGAIRLDIPRPTVHARNLFHVSAAMWDAWATYDTTASGYFYKVRNTDPDVTTARQTAISYAAYRVLMNRYATAIGGAQDVACFNAFMAKLGLDPNDTTTTGTSAIAIGNQIGAAVIAATANDGSNQAHNYADTTNYMPVNMPLQVNAPGTACFNPNHWQELNLAEAVTQNGIITTAGVQTYIGAQWGLVTPFALVRPSPGSPYVDPGAIPTFGTTKMMTSVMDVLQHSASMDATDGQTMDISPASYGNNSLGMNDGTGYAMNPVTGQPYVPEIVARGDFGRVMAEFWADGPKSETPPGHWNVIANQYLADNPTFQRQLGGTGPVLDPLQWDVKVYLALNGAVHDAAIAGWEAKRINTTSRPITLVRYMAQLGQSSDPTQPAYNMNGLPLVPGAIQLITAANSAPGQPLANLSRYVGELAVYSYPGQPGDPVHESAGVQWIRAIEWVPYQKDTFVTPSFPGFFSGHSVFSRAGAEVLATLTGSPYFPGGLGTYTVPVGGLTFEKGPTGPVTLQWATFYDASDEAGQSRIYGGIHLVDDDFAGRIAGSAVGKAAVAKAQTYYNGTAPQ